MRKYNKTVPSCREKNCLSNGTLNIKNDPAINTCSYIPIITLIILKPINVL